MTGQPASDQTLVDHEIAVGNLIWGHAQFLTIRMPEVWDLAPGVGRPEIVASHERKGKRWVVTGKAWYVLFHRERGWAMELLLESRVKRKQHPVSTGEQATVHGHPASIRRWERKRGVFKPRTITFVELLCDCDETDRSLKVELSGRCPAEGFEEMLRMIAKWHCH